MKSIEVKDVLKAVEAGLKKTKGGGGGLYSTT